MRTRAARRLSEISCSPIRFGGAHSALRLRNGLCLLYYQLFVNHRLTGAVRVYATTAPRTDPKQRIVITGMGIASVFGNDCDVFYDRYV